MMQLKLLKPSEEKKWQIFLTNSNNATLFQDLNFLRYHPKDFQKTFHHLYWLKGEEIYAALTLGLIKKEKKNVAISCPGASWGGLVEPKKFQLKYGLEIVESLVKYLKRRKIDTCQITLAPACYQTRANDYFRFSLTTSGFKLLKQEIQNIVYLPKNPKEVMTQLEKKARNQSRSALESFKIKEDVTPADFYPILIQDKDRHRSKPTHSLIDLEDLKDLLKDKIRFDIAEHKETGAKAGICYFVTGFEGLMTFYMAQEDKAVGQNGLNALVVSGMIRAVKEGFKFIDFGTSSVNNKIENLGLVDFKEGFGLGGFNRETYEIKL